MKKLVSLLLVIALLFGFGFTVSHFVAKPPQPEVADDIPTPPLPPTQWPPTNDNSLRRV